MPAIGVYPVTAKLWEHLVDEYNIVTDQVITANFLGNGIVQIQQDLADGMNPFICRERYRAWVEQTFNLLGIQGLPPWDDIIKKDEWPLELLDLVECSTDYAWEVFFSDNFDFPAFEEIWSESDGIEDIMEKLQAVADDGSTVALHVQQFAELYVVKSPYVRGCGVAAWAVSKGDIADGEVPGSIDSYVLQFCAASVEGANATYLLPSVGEEGA